MSDDTEREREGARYCVHIFFFFASLLFLSPLFPLPKLKTVLQRSLSKFYEVVYPNRFIFPSTLLRCRKNKKRVETANARENVVPVLSILHHERTTYSIYFIRFFSSARNSFQLRIDLSSWNFSFSRNPFFHPILNNQIRKHIRIFNILEESHTRITKSKTWQNIFLKIWYLQMDSRRSILNSW